MTKLNNILKLAVVLNILMLSACKDAPTTQSVGLPPYSATALKANFKMHLGNEANVIEKLTTSSLESKPVKPEDYKNVIVNIDHIELLLSGGGKAARVITNKNFGALDLMALSRGLPLPLTEFNIPDGVKIHQIRLILKNEGNLIVTLDDVQHDLKTPSAQKSGLKIIINEPIEFEAPFTYSFLIDFNAAKSIVAQGNGGFLLKPVIKLATVLKIPFTVDDNIVDVEEGYEDVVLIDDVVTVIDEEIPGVEETTTEPVVDPVTDPVTVVEPSPTDTNVYDFSTIDINDPTTWPDGITPEELDAYFGLVGLQ